MYGSSEGGGVTRTKPEHPNRRIDITMYAECFEWLREQMRPIGWNLDMAVFDPELGLWYAYDDGQLVLKLEHETIERIWEQLRVGQPVPE